jgi:hypothetical protein
MQPNIYLYCICYFSPYMFRALIGPSSGVSWAAYLCYHLVHAVLLSVRASADSGLVVHAGLEVTYTIKTYNWLHLLDIFIL